LTLLAMAAVVAVATYRQLPWARFERASAPVAAPLVDARVARAKALTAELEAWLAAPVTFAQVPALEDRLSRLRRDGAASVAASLAARAARRLEDAASRELDAGELDAGISHYKVALDLDPGAPGTSPLTAVLRARAQAALDAGRPADAVRWARTARGLAEADPDAHALLAEALFAAHDDAAAVVEFGKALASRPTDPAFRRGFERAQRRVARAAAPRVHKRSAAAEPGAGGPDAGAVAPEGASTSETEARPAREKPEPAEPQQKAIDKSTEKAMEKSADKATAKATDKPKSAAGESAPEQ
jgi:tetratricopeptide (TPR) repeat protein